MNATPVRFHNSQQVAEVCARAYFLARQKAIQKALARKRAETAFSRARFYSPEAADKAKLSLRRFSGEN